MSKGLKISKTRLVGDVWNGSHAKILLPKVKISDITDYFEKAGISDYKCITILIPKASIIEDKFDDKFVFVNEEESFIVPSLTVDLGDKYEAEERYHSFKDITLGTVNNACKNNERITISFNRNYIVSTYTTAANKENCRIVIPRGQYKGLNFTVAKSQIKDINDKFVSLSINAGAKLRISKNEKQADGSYITVKEEYISFSDITNDFKNPNRVSKSVSLENVASEVNEIVDFSNDVPCDLDLEDYEKMNLDDMELPF